MKAARRASSSCPPLNKIIERCAVFEEIELWTAARAVRPENAPPRRRKKYNRLSQRGDGALRDGDPSTACLADCLLSWNLHRFGRIHSA